MAQGGYRKPASPAPASGPGQLSRRTDGGPGQPVRDLPDPAYGEGQDFRGLQQGAPMQGAQGAPNLAGPSSPPQATPPTPFGAPTANPDEPVTAGAASGPGAGSEALGIGDPQAENARAMLPYLPAMEIMASSPQATPAFRNYVRLLRGQMPT